MGEEEKKTRQLCLPEWITKDLVLEFEVVEGGVQITVSWRWIGITIKLSLEDFGEMLANILGQLPDQTMWEVMEQHLQNEMEKIEEMVL